MCLSRRARGTAGGLSEMYLARWGYSRDLNGLRSEQRAEWQTRNLQVFISHRNNEKISMYHLRFSEVTLLKLRSLFEHLQPLRENLPWGIVIDIGEFPSPAGSSSPALFPQPFGRSCGDGPHVSLWLAGASVSNRDVAL